MTDLFRREAIEHYAGEARRSGDVLRLSPDWIRRTFWLLAGLTGVGALFAALAPIPEYADGPAVVWMEPTLVTARVAGTVDSIPVQDLDSVRVGDPLVYLDAEDEVATLNRFTTEFDLQLVNRLTYPLDQDVCTALRSLRAERALAQERLNERCLRAPHAGVVTDLHVHEGQHVLPGDVLLSLNAQTSDSGRTILALLPASFRPLLKVGAPLRLEPSGYRYVYRTATIERIDRQVLGPSAVRRYLGQQMADAVPVQGPVILVQARLRSGRFLVGGRPHDLYHGMQGTAAVWIRSQTLLQMLIPWWESGERNWAGTVGRDRASLPAITKDQLAVTGAVTVSPAERCAGRGMARTIRTITAESMAMAALP